MDVLSQFMETRNKKNRLLDLEEEKVPDNQINSL
jgi:hypothetical protein